MRRKAGQYTTKKINGYKLSLENLLFWKLIHIFVSKLGEIASRYIWMTTRVAKFIDIGQVAGWQGERPQTYTAKVVIVVVYVVGLRMGTSFCPLFIWLSQIFVR